MSAGRRAARPGRASAAARRPPPLPPSSSLPPPASLVYTRSCTFLPLFFAHRRASSPTSPRNGRSAAEVCRQKPKGPRPTAHHASRLTPHAPRPTPTPATNLVPCGPSSTLYSPPDVPYSYALLLCPLTQAPLRQRGGRRPLSVGEAGHRTLGAVDHRTLDAACRQPLGAALRARPKRRRC